MTARPIRVTVLGTTDGAFDCSPELFTHAALKHGGVPVWAPPPFAAPCTDGLLILYTLRSSQGDAVEVHGGYILVSRRVLEEEFQGKPICRFWSQASKTLDSATMLRSMGFGRPSSLELN